jgi:hypothetical protein
MPSSQTRQIWENGIPLCDAWLEMASDDAKRFHSELPGFGDMLSAATGTSGWAGISKTLMAANDATQRRRQNEIRLQDDLLESLFNGQFIATGFVRSIIPRPKPVIIEPDIFDGDANVDWRNSIISNLGVTYDNVRIGDPDELVTRPQKRIGRPGSGEAINAAIDILLNSDPKFCTENRKTACEKIRSHLGNQATDQSGLSDINLAKYIRRKCPKRVITITS